MPGAAGAEHAAEGIIAKAAKAFLRDARGPVERAAGRQTAEHAGVRGTEDALSAGERAAAKVSDDAGKVNPNFDPNNPAYSCNCTHCVQAYELRRRGLDVEASALPKKYFPSGGRPLSDIEGRWGRSFARGSKEDIEKAFAEDGSRGVVFIQWKNGGGHVFNVENVDGTVRFIDGQTGQVGVGHYFDHGANTGYVRLDDLPSPGGGEFTVPAKGVEVAP